MLSHRPITRRLMMVSAHVLLLALAVYLYWSSHFFGWYAAAVPERVDEAMHAFTIRYVLLVLTVAVQVALILVSVIRKARKSESDPSSSSGAGPEVMS